MKGFSALILYNVKLQFRQGFTAAWIVITFFYLLALYFIPSQMAIVLLPLILLSEPTTFAMIFTGAILLLEKEEGILNNLFITPLNIRAYILSKAIALSLPAIGSALILTVLIRGIHISLILLPIGIFLTMIFFVCYSIIPASASKDLPGLIGRIGLYASPFVLSVMDYFHITRGPWHYLLPTKGTLDLMSMTSGRNEFSILKMILSLASLILWIILILPLAERSFRKNIILKGGNA